MLCTACASELDFAYAHHQAGHRMQMSSMGFGRLMGAGGQIAGQALGAVATGTLGGAARLFTGCACGARSAMSGLRAVEVPVAPSLQRPRALEEYDISDARQWELPW